MGGGSGGSGSGGRSGGGGGSTNGDAGQPGEVVRQANKLSDAQIGTAQGKVASIVESTLAAKWSGKLTSYQANSLNFLAEQRGRKTPLTEKQAAWMGKLAREAAQYNPKLGQSYLNEKILKQIGL